MYRGAETGNQFLLVIDSSPNLLEPLVKVRFLKNFDIWAYPVLLYDGGLGLEEMKEGLKGWIDVESAG